MSSISGKIIESRLFSIIHDRRNQGESFAEILLEIIQEAQSINYYYDLSKEFPEDSLFHVASFTMKAKNRISNHE